MLGGPTLARCGFMTDHGDRGKVWQDCLPSSGALAVAEADHLHPEIRKGVWATPGEVPPYPGLHRLPVAPLHPEKQKQGARVAGGPLRALLLFRWGPPLRAVPQMLAVLYPLWRPLRRQGLCSKFVSKGTGLGIHPQESLAPEGNFVHGCLQPHHCSPHCTPTPALTPALGLRWGEGCTSGSGLGQWRCSGSEGYTTAASACRRCLQMHQIVEEGNLAPIDRGQNAYITHIAHHPNPEPQHTRVGGGGSKKKKESPRDILHSVEGWSVKK